MEMICILCPMGCALNVEREGDGVRVAGNACARGAKYGEQELINPLRVVTGSVRVDGAELPLCPVKTAGMVPKAQIGAVLDAILHMRAKAPVHVGDVLIPDVANTGIDVVATAPR